MFKRTLIMVSILALTACGGKTYESPARTVYLAESTYAAALQAEVAYVKLPLCDQKKEIVNFCSKPDIVAKLRKADDAAFNALKIAQGIVRQEGETSAEAIRAVEAAINLTNQFRQLAGGEGSII